MSDPTFYQQLNQAERWCVIRDYHDGSGIVAVYGLFDSQEIAKKALDALGDHCNDRFRVMPFTLVYTDILDPTKPPDGTL